MGINPALTKPSFSQSLATTTTTTRVSYSPDPRATRKNSANAPNARHVIHVHQIEHARLVPQSRCVIQIGSREDTPITTASVGWRDDETRIADLEWKYGSDGAFRMEDEGLHFRHLPRGRSCGNAKMGGGSPATLSRVSDDDPLIFAMRHWFWMKGRNLHARNALDSLVLPRMEGQRYGCGSLGPRP